MPDELSQGGGRGIRARLAGLRPRISAPRAPRISLALPVRASPYAGALFVLAVAVLFVAGITWYGSREFSRRAADRRAADEARSFAEHSALLATGDAFGGYVQILRYGDDPVLRFPAATPEQRLTALRQLLYLNTNRFSSLAIADRAGTVLATTDPSLRSVRESAAFQATRADLGPANSDVILPEGGDPYVEFTTVLRADDGAAWGVVYGRAEASRLWTGTLHASVDGGRNVIINNEGQFSAGVPESLLGQPWRGEPLANGSVRADIAGTDSICGLGPIGKDTQIDHGWNVASCLPVSLIAAEAGAASDRQLLVTAAAAVLALVIGGGVLRTVLPGDGAPRREEAPEQDEAATDVPDAPPAVAAVSDDAPEPAPAAAAPVTEAAARAEDGDGEVEEAAEGGAEGDAVDGDESEPPAPPPVIVAADVDALSLIDAYERRSAKLAERLLDAVQARLMLVSARIDESHKLARTDPDIAGALHASAMEELEAVRNVELRGLAQELYPGLVRLGLGSALRALKKELADRIELTLDVSAEADSVEGTAGRARVDQGRRLVLFRGARNALEAISLAGAFTCELSLTRDERHVLTLTVRGEAEDEIDGERLAAERIALEAYGGTCAIEQVEGGASTITITLPSPPAGVTAEASEVEEEAAADVAALLADSAGDLGQADGEDAA